MDFFLEQTLIIGVYLHQEIKYLLNVFIFVLKRYITRETAQ